jgi:DNA gyrase subunit B
MQELIRAGRIYVAQPPLYQVTRRKKSEYVLNERVMRQTLTSLGTEGTTLIIRNDDGVDVGSITGEPLLHTIELLNRLEELVKVVSRRGIDFADFLGRREAGHLPTFRLVVDGVEAYFSTADARDQYLKSHDLWAEEEILPAADLEGAVPVVPKVKEAPVHKLQLNQEMHEVKELEKLFVQLDELGLSIDDYFLTQEESVSGEKLATKFALLNDGKLLNVAGVSQILPMVHSLAKQGLEIKRFKGLGEMNSEELWETTLDPSKRVLLRVNLLEAVEAERMFSVLMGEDVERRRKFIEEHALEVKNLDV